MHKVKFRQESIGQQSYRHLLLSAWNPLPHLLRQNPLELVPPSQSVQGPGVGALPPPFLEPGRDVRRPVQSEHLLTQG